MKYLVLIPDGMADRPDEKLGGKTPMELAEKPVMDALASKSFFGSAMNVPSHMVPESDTANLSILSYNPAVYSKGRSPLEAMSLGIEMDDDDTAIRCNIVTLSDDEPYEEKTMIDHSAGEITTAEADELVKALNASLGNEMRTLHTGVSYRHCLIWKGADDKYDFSRPHDIIGQKIKDYLPKADNGGAEFLGFMKKSAEVLKDHPVNLKRRAEGKREANSAWLWSPGKKPALPSFREKWGLDGTVVCAVDLIKGIGICAGMKTVNVDGATGNYYTNYEGKAKAAREAFENGSDFVYIHVEAPDECGHLGEYENKISSIEKIDSLILKPLLGYLEGTGEPFKIMVLPDHPTPLSIRTHSHECVPFFIYDSEKTQKGPETFTEKTCLDTDTYIEDGSELLEIMIGKER